MDDQPSARTRSGGWRRPRPTPPRRRKGRCASAHQLRHAQAVELAHEGVPLNVIQRQLRHTNLGVTSIYLQGIDNARSSPPSTPAGRP
jgi:integrase